MEVPTVYKLSAVSGVLCPVLCTEAQSEYSRQRRAIDLLGRPTAGAGRRPLSLAPCASSSIRLFGSRKGSCISTAINKGINTRQGPLKTIHRR